MTRLLQSIKLLLVLVALVLTWCINPILALCRVKTPIRRYLLSKLPMSDL